MDFLVAVIVLLLSVILLLPLFKNYKERKRIAQYIDKLPGEKWYPIIGTTLKALKTNRADLFDLLSARHKKFGPFVRSWYGRMPFVHIYKPEHAQVIFRSSIESNKGQAYRFLFPWLGHGLISGSGPHWKAHRKIITPSFHFKMLDNYGDIFAEKSEDFVKYLKKFEGKGYFEITEHLNCIGLDIITETAMGVKLNLLEGKDGKHIQFSQAISDFCGTVFKRLYNPALAIDFIFNRLKIGKESQKNVEIINKFTKNVIKQRKEYFKTHKSELMQINELGMKKKLSFLNMLLAYQEEHDFTDEEIQEEVNTFMFAGQDTTVSALTFAFMALGNNPDVTKHVQEELDSIFADDPNRKITPQDISKMEYLDRVLKEVLRCYNFVPILARTITEDVKIDGVVIPKGCNITINLYDLHHDPDHYPDPFKFDPDRFLPEVVAKRHPYAYTPFSAGPRNCLGQKFAMRNIKTLLASILRQYNLTCLEKGEDLKYFVEIVLRPQTGIHIALESRKR